MGEPQPTVHLRMDREAYLAFERGAEGKHTFWDGEVFAMTGASTAHNCLVVNLIAELFNALKGSECRALPSDMRVRIPGRDRYVYPDVTVVCGSIQTEDADVLTNPRTIIEVLSPSTELFDRGAKFASYRTMPSVREVVFVSQTERRVEVYTRNGDHHWLYADHQLDDAVPLAELAPALTLAQIYDQVPLSPD